MAGAGTIETSDRAVEAIVSAALGGDAGRILEEAKTAGANVPFEAEGSRRERPTAVDVAFPSPERLVVGLKERAPAAISAALQGARAFDDETLLEPALWLAQHGKGELRRASIFALGTSRDDRALEYLLGALTSTTIPRPALARSRHPQAPARVRLAFEGADEAVAAVALEVLAELDPRGALTIALRTIDAPASRALRRAAANALAKIDDPAARTWFEAHWRDEDESVARTAMRDTLLRAPTRAWTLASELDGGGELAQLFALAHGGATPRRFGPADDPLVREPRWLDLAARFRRDERIGGYARSLLSVAPRERAVAAIERHPISRTPRGPVTMPSRRDFLARYEGGDYAAWDALVEHAGAVATDAVLREEAVAVARSLMKRVRRNADAARAVLTAAGARLAPEGPVGPELRARLESASGAPLPIAMAAFFEMVGTISLLPAPPSSYDYGPCTLERDGISLLAADPIMVGDAGYIEYQLKEYETSIRESHPEIVGPLRLDLSPDYLHKQDISGGASYAVEFPPFDDAEAVDPLFLHERHRASLVGYLRLAFRWGGFPGLDADDASSREAAERVVNAFAKDLIPF